MANKKVKGVYFNLDNEQDLSDYADTLDNFSQFVKEKLFDDKRLKEQGTPKTQRLDSKEIADLVQQLVKTELAGHVIATDHIENNEEDLDMDQFF